jgi:hypothetical protein
MECENCNKLHEGKYGSGRFCCEKCSRSFSSLKNRDEKNKKISLSLKGRFIGELSSAYKKWKDKGDKIGICPICNKEFNKSRKKIFCSRECYLNDVDFKYKKKVPGGYRKGSSRGKSGYYKEYWCDSSYELAFVIYNIDHNIKFKRNKEGFPYVHEGVIRRFFPDFKNETQYFEIKNFHSSETDSKIKYFPFKIEVLYKEDLKKEILPYVINKYGKDFINLYE